MKCLECNKQVRCVDSRKKLSYVSTIRKGHKEPIRERKYICGKCNLVFITREFLFSECEGRNIKDKRVQKKKKNKS